MDENTLASLASELRFRLSKLRERLWLRPLLYCLAAIACVFFARLPDFFHLGQYVFGVEPETVEKLLTILSSSMLAVATFAVASMVSAYASASSTATPRAFAVVVSDDASKTALSSFIGAFIFAIVGIIAVETGYYERAGLFFLFLITLGLFIWVVLTFIRWVDRIARLGRMGHIIQKVEETAGLALENFRRNPNLGGVPADPQAFAGDPVYTSAIGFVQHIDLPALQAFAEENDAVVTVAALPGAFIASDRPLAFVWFEGEHEAAKAEAGIASAFIMGNERTFRNDPRFGLVVLSEIASRALSPAVNDPGTAMAVAGSLLRLLCAWSKPLEDGEKREPEFDRVHIPALSADEMLDDAFLGLSRDGAGFVEVGLRLQRGFQALAKYGTQVGRDDLARAAKLQSEAAMRRAEKALVFSDDLKRLKSAAFEVVTAQLEETALSKQVQ